MSLTICRECGKAISTKAEVCPNCGGPVTKYPPLDEYKYILSNFEKYDSHEKEHLEERINELLELTGVCPVSGFLTPFQNVLKEKVKINLHL